MTRDVSHHVRQEWLFTEKSKRLTAAKDHSRLNKLCLTQQYLKVDRESDQQNMTSCFKADCFSFDTEAFQTQHSRVRSASFGVGGSQVVTAGHKDVELSQLLDVVDGELDVSLHLQVPVVAVVQGHHTSTHLQANESPNVFRLTAMSTMKKYICFVFYAETWFVNCCDLVRETFRAPEGGWLPSCYSLKPLTFKPRFHTEVCMKPRFQVFTSMLIDTKASPRHNFK